MMPPWISQRRRGLRLPNSPPKSPARRSRLPCASAGARPAPKRSPAPAVASAPLPNRRRVTPVLAEAPKFPIIIPAFRRRHQGAPSRHTSRHRRVKRQELGVLWSEPPRAVRPEASSADDRLRLAIHDPHLLKIPAGLRRGRLPPGRGGGRGLIDRRT